jgi:formylglycine-generating enzyme required for sulfatase activity
MNAIAFLSTGVPLLVSALPCAAQTPVPCTIQHEAEGMTNRVRLSWEATPDSFYRLWTAMDLHHTWGLMTWLWATNAATNPLPVSCADTNLQTRRFYRVVEVPVPDWLTNSSALLLEAAERYQLTYIPPGTFTMGSPPTEPARWPDEGPQTTVMISQGFWMGRYEVTQGGYLDVMGTNPSYFTGDLNRPVERVNWNEATNYCARLTDRERGTGRLPEGYVYRLPTEAEWEYTCRAGTTSAFHYGSELRSGMANFEGHYEYPPCGNDRSWCFNPGGIYLGRTTAVGSYPPNVWGLYDVHGNVWEWCMDWAGLYPGGTVADPQGPATGTSRVVRSGGWNYRGRSCRSAHRNWLSPEFRDFFLGFRVVLARPLP